MGVITDAHFGPEAYHRGKLRKLTSQAPELTEAFAQRMRDEIRPDIVINLGDVVQDESPEADLRNYHRFLSIVRRSGAELVHVAGNHDRVNLSTEALRRAWGLKAGGPLYRSFDRGDIHVVVLYGHERDNVDVALGDEQLAWLADDLSAARDTVVLLHHSPVDQDLQGNRWFEGRPEISLLRDRLHLRRLLRDHGRTRLVLNGHLHWNHVAVVDGIPYVTLQSLVENIEDDAPGRPAAAHAVVRLDDREISIEIAGAHPGRYQFVH